MTPFYTDPLVTIYHADFRLCARTFDVAAVITDPPYEETGFAWDEWPDGWPAWVLAHCPGAPSLWCWGSFRMFRDHHAEFADWALAQDTIWEKANGSSLHTDRFRRVHELAVHFYPKRAKWADVFKAPVIRTVTEERKRHAIKRQGAPAQWGRVDRNEVSYDYDGTRLARSVMFAPAVRHGIRHGTPKPLTILRDLVSYSVPPGGAVLDPMCGSGSTLVAAKELGRHAIGIDGDIEAVTEAAERCAATMTLAAR